MGWRANFGLEKKGTTPTLSEKYEDFKFNLDATVSLINRAYSDIGVEHPSGSGDFPEDAMALAHKKIDVAETRKILSKLDIAWIVLDKELGNTKEFDTPEISADRIKIGADLIKAREELVRLEEEERETQRKVA